MRQKPVRAYLEPELAAEVARRARAQGRSDSSVIAEAVRARLASTSEQTHRIEAETTRRQLHRVEARLDKLIWEQLQLKRALLLFIRVWLEHNPPLSTEEEESAAASAEARYDRFIDLLAEAIAATDRGDDIEARFSDERISDGEAAAVTP